MDKVKIDIPWHRYALIVLLTDRMHASRQNLARLLCKSWFTYCKQYLMFPLAINTAYIFTVPFAASLPMT